VNIHNNVLNSVLWQNMVAEKDELCVAQWIMRDSPNYAEAPQLCAKLCVRIIA